VKKKKFQKRKDKNILSVSLSTNAEDVGKKIKMGLGSSLGHSFAKKKVSKEYLDEIFAEEEKEEVDPKSKSGSVIVRGSSTVSSPKRQSKELTSFLDLQIDVDPRSFKTATDADLSGLIKEGCTSPRSMSSETDVSDGEQNSKLITSTRVDVASPEKYFARTFGVGRYTKGEGFPRLKRIKQSKRKEVFIEIAREEVKILDAATESVLESYRYPLICNWGFEKSTFVFIVDQEGTNTFGYRTKDASEIFTKLAITKTMFIAGNYGPGYAQKNLPQFMMKFYNNYKRLSMLSQDKDPDPSNDNNTTSSANNKTKHTPPLIPPRKKLPPTPAEKAVNSDESNEESGVNEEEGDSNDNSSGAHDSANNNPSGLEKRSVSSEFLESDTDNTPDSQDSINDNNNASATEASPLDTTNVNSDKICSNNDDESNEDKGLVQEERRYRSQTTNNTRAGVVEKFMKNNRDDDYDEDDDSEDNQPPYRPNRPHRSTSLGDIPRIKSPLSSSDETDTEPNNNNRKSNTSTSPLVMQTSFSCNDLKKYAKDSKLKASRSDSGEEDQQENQQEGQEEKRKIKGSGGNSSSDEGNERTKVKKREPPILLEVTNDNCKPTKDKLNKPRRTPPPRPVDQKSKGKRKKALKELITTEISYNRDLDILVDIWMGSLKDELTEEQINAIFSNVLAIRNLNKELMKSMEGVEYLDEVGQNIGQRFLGFVAFLRLYTQYCSNYNKALAVLAEVRRNNESLERMLDEIQHHEFCANLNLQGFLIKPLQRVTKYPLLLKALLEYTPPTHPDYGNLTTCLQDLQDVVSVINDHTKRNDNISLLLEIQQKFSHHQELKIVEASRKFLQQETFNKIVLGKAIIKNCILLLFNDMILLAVKKGNKYTPKSPKIPIRDVLVWNVDTDKKSNYYAFSIVGQETEKITVFTNSEEQKIEWMDYINDALVNLPNVKLLKSLETSRTIELFRSTTYESIKDA